MPLNLSFTHLMVVAIVALVVLGPERLPQVARTAGNFYREWQRIRGGLEGEVREAINEFKEPFREPVQQMHDSVKGAVDDIRRAPGAGGSQTNGSSGAESVTVAAGNGAAVPLAAAVPLLPTLGGDSQLFSPGPVVVGAELPELAPQPNPDTFVPFDPAGPA